MRLEKAKKEFPFRKVIDNNEIFYYKMRDYFNGEQSSNLNDATIYFYINKTAFNGLIRYNKDGEFNVPYGRYKTFNADLLTEKHANLLKSAKLMSESYQHSFKLAKSNDFMFLDPPYDCSYHKYGNAEDFAEDEQRKLAEDFKNLSCKALMVIGKTQLTSELYQNYVLSEYSKKYSINIKNRVNSSTKHLIIANYKLYRN